MLDQQLRPSAGKWVMRPVRTALLALGALVFTAVPALADEGHLGHGSTPVTGGGEVLLWGGLSLGVIFLLLITSRLVLLRQVAGAVAGAGQSVGYLTAARQFSRNARLFLGYSLMAELGSGVWSVMFNLYLLRVGFPVSFIGSFWLVNMLCHGLAALPAGVIADRFGRRRSFFIAMSCSLAAQGALLFTVQPAAILILAGLAGFGDSFHGVTGSPFMMDNSEPKERPHLFSLNAAFTQFSRFAGNLSGGFLPLGLAMVIGVPAVDPAAARWALVAGLPVTLIALLPLAFMREKPVQHVESLRDMVALRNVEHFGLIGRFTLLSVVVGVGFGLTVRFFNVFFQEGLGADDRQVGTILALGAAASAGSTLISPVLTQTLGKARSIFLTQALSVPFLLAMALISPLTAVTTLFLVRGALSSIGMPLRNQLQMEFISSRERGTAAGFTHMAFDIGGGLGAGLAGALVADAGFAPAFAAAAVLIVVPAFFYYQMFHGLEWKTREQALGVVQPVGLVAG